jgi:hypothetical protein
VAVTCCNCQCQQLGSASSHTPPCATTGACGICQTSHSTAKGRSLPGCQQHHGSCYMQIACSATSAGDALPDRMDLGWAQGGPLQGVQHIVASSHGPGTMECRVLLRLLSTLQSPYNCTPCPTRSPPALPPAHMHTPALSVCCTCEPAHACCLSFTAGLLHGAPLAEPAARLLPWLLGGLQAWAAPGEGQQAWAWASHTCRCGTVGRKQLVRS